MHDLIEGVIVTPLKRVENERGGLMEVQRCDDPHFPGFGQVYVTQSLAGVVKAWYRHTTQVDQIAAINGRVKLVLYDEREGSPTRSRLNEVMMGEDSPNLVLIPPGIWHGFIAMGDTGAYLLHLNDQAFNFGQPDEEKIAIDDPRIPYRW